MMGVIFAYYGGAVFWMLDLFYCEHVRPYQFHSIWHFMAGYGAYLWVVALMKLRADSLKKVSHSKIVVGKDYAPFLAHYLAVKLDHPE